jgi:hypothetical protein
MRAVCDCSPREHSPGQQHANTTQDNDINTASTHPMRMCVHVQTLTPCHVHPMRTCRSTTPCHVSAWRCDTVRANQQAHDRQSVRMLPSTPAVLLARQRATSAASSSRHLAALRPLDAHSVTCAARVGVGVS